MILSFHRQVDEDGAPLGFYTASSGNTLPTFRNKLSGSIPAGQESFWPIGCPETSIMNYHYSLHNSQEERSSGTVIYMNAYY